MSGVGHPRVAGALMIGAALLVVGSWAWALVQSPTQWLFVGGLAEWVAFGVVIAALGPLTRQPWNWWHLLRREATLVLLPGVIWAAVDFVVLLDRVFRTQTHEQLVAGMVYVKVVDIVVPLVWAALVLVVRLSGRTRSGQFSE